MSALTWLALGLALLVVPLDAPLAARTQVLARGGRLAAPATDPASAPATGRAVATAGLAVPIGVAGAVAAVTGVGVVGGVVLAVAAAIAVATAGRLAVVALRARAARRRDAAVLTALRLMAGELEAGALPAAACAAAAEACPPHRDELHAAAAACRRGDGPRFDSPGLAGLAAAWQVAAVAGAPLADVVRRLGDDLAARVDQQRAVAAALAGARSSAAMLAGLPVLGLLLGAAMQAHPLAVLISTPAGRMLTLVGVAFDAAGLLWTQRLATGAERGL